MKILVCAKQVLDPTSRVQLKPDGSGVDLLAGKLAMNPFDEIALEEAVRLRELGMASEIIVVSVGRKQSQDVLRAGLAMGAGRAILVETADRVEPLAVAKIVAALVRRESPGLVLMGKQAIDDDSNQTGQMLAALLDWPQGTFVSKVKLLDGAVRVDREVDDGLETLRLTLPAVLTADLRLNQPRYATLPNIMKARRLPIEVLAPADLGVDIAPRHTIVSFAQSGRKRTTSPISVDELATLLRHESQTA